MKTVHHRKYGKAVKFKTLRYGTTFIFEGDCAPDSDTFPPVYMKGRDATTIHLDDGDIDQLADDTDDVIPVDAHLVVEA